MRKQGKSNYKICYRNNKSIKLRKLRIRLKVRRKRRRMEKRKRISNRHQMLEMEVNAKNITGIKLLKKSPSTFLYQRVQQLKC